MENDSQPDRDSGSTSASPAKKLVILLVALVVLLALAVLFYLRSPAPPEPELINLPAPVTMPPPAPAPPPPPPEPEPELEPPVEVPPPPPKPLPSLNESDTVVREEIGELQHGQQAIALVVRDELIRKFVRAVHVLATDGTVVHEYRPVMSPQSTLQVERAGTADEEIKQRYHLLEANYRRYDPYVSLLARMDPDTLVKLYTRFLPLMDRAYEEQGVDNGGFHGVMLAALDRVLSAQHVEGTRVLVRPRVFYEYEDAALERLPGSDKLMLRMGPDNAQSVKSSLRRLRTRLADVDVE